MRRIVAFGDLVLCVRANVPVASFARIPAHEDVVFNTPVMIDAGGTAITFCQAARACPDIEPIAIGCAGKDREGAVIRHEILEQGLAVDGLQETERGSTSVILTAYSTDRARMMLQPADHANNFLEAAPMMELLARLSDVCLVWISGYSLERRDVPRFAAAQAICDWARNAAIPIVVDLVPHAFIEAVGDLAALEALIGAYQGVVTTTATAVELGYGPAERPQGTFDAAQVQHIAISLSNRTGFASVEHRVNGEYHQSVAVSGKLVMHRVFGNEETAEANFGDRLAVEGLRAAGLL